MVPVVPTENAKKGSLQRLPTRLLMLTADLKNRRGKGYSIFMRIRCLYVFVIKATEYYFCFWVVPTDFFCKVYIYTMFDVPPLDPAPFQFLNGWALKDQAPLFLANNLKIVFAELMGCLNLCKTVQRCTFVVFNVQLSADIIPQGRDRSKWDIRCARINSCFEIWTSADTKIFEALFHLTYPPC